MINDPNMRTIKFHYFSDRRLSSLIIRARLASKFQHVGIELDDGSYVDSTMAYGGVKFRPLPDNIHTTNTIIVHKDRYDEVLEFIKSIENTRYDKKALLGFFVFRKFESENHWFCSEAGLKIYELATQIVIDQHVLISPGGLRLMTETYQKMQELCENTH